MVVALLLLVCMLCPFVEMAFHSNDNIFLTGKDMESAFAILLLVVELLFASAGLLVFCLTVTREESLVVPHSLLSVRSGFVRSLPDASPAIPLRI
jgi:hypothetical protein